MTALLDDGVEALFLTNRSTDRARALAARAGDPRVRVIEHADAVADAVVAGQSAEQLLDQVTGGGAVASQAVQMKGKAATMTHRITKPTEMIVRGVTRDCALVAMSNPQTDLRLKSRQVRISTGISRKATPMIVRTEVAPAEP